MSFGLLARWRRVEPIRIRWMTERDPAWGVNWRQVRILYLRELRGALRERAIVINSVLIPVLLYPLILWAAFTGIMFVQGQTEGFVSRILVAEWPKGHPGLHGRFQRDKRLQLVEQPTTATAAEQRIRNGNLDAFVEFLPAAGTNAVLAGNFQVRITFNESRERSASARNRVTAVIEGYREEWIKREAGARGIGAAAWEGFRIQTRNVASKKQMGAFLLGMVLPVLFVVMVAMGCFYPAVDATAGERERNTWETLMSTAASRVSLVTAKYLYVTTMGGLAGVLNLAAMAVTMKPIFAPLMAGTDDTFRFTVPLGAIPVMVLAAVMLAGFVSAGMMIFASFARSFREGQALITPFYLVVLLPVVFLQTPGLQFSPLLALVPIVNVTLMVRAALAGAFPILQIGLTLAASLALIAACLRLAAFVLQFEDVMLGSYNGSFRKFIRERVWQRRPSAARGVES
jgi:sodium transport system permease protein